MFAHAHNIPKLLSRVREPTCTCMMKDSKARAQHLYMYMYVILSFFVVSGSRLFLSQGYFSAGSVLVLAVMKYRNYPKNVHP